MPEALQINWTLAKVLRGQGLRWEDIAPQVHAKPATLRTRACREGWSNIRQETANALAQYGFKESAKLIKEQAPKLAEAWLSEMQSDTVERLERLRKLPKPTNLDDAKKLEETMLTHVKVGRSSFGLDDQKGGGVSINIMSQLCQIAAVQQGVTSVAEDCMPDATHVADASQVIDSEGD